MSAAPADAPHVFSPAYYERLREIEDQHWWAIGMRETAAAIARPALPPGPLAILDAGCGTGAALGWLRDLGSGGPVHGIDLAADAIEHCKRRGERYLRIGSVLDLPFPDGSFDLVHSGDVLQHLPTAAGPERALAECRRVLRRGGLLLLRTNADPGSRQVSDEHYQRFTRRTLEHLLERAGFESLRVTYVNCLPSLFGEMSSRLRTRSIQPSGDHGLRIRLYPPHLAWLNRALLFVLRLEARYLCHVGSSLPFGHTLLAVARRPR